MTPALHGLAYVMFGETSERIAAHGRSRAMAEVTSLEPRKPVST
jgi:hypothetical protein